MVNEYDTHTRRRRRPAPSQVTEYMKQRQSSVRHDQAGDGDMADLTQFASEILKKNNLTL